MEVQIGIELRREKSLESIGMFGGDEPVADVLPHDGSVLALDSSVVGSAIGARLGEVESSLFSIVAMRSFRNSLPLTEWNPRIQNGYWCRIASNTGNMCRSLIVSTHPMFCHCVTVSTELR